MARGSIEERFWSKVDKSEGCWSWTGYVQKNGYGKFRRDPGPMVTAHRMSYELEHGDIPEGMQVDHMCHTRTCVNPSHLRLLTNKQNNENRRGPQANSVTGVRGVSPQKGTGRFVAVVGKWNGPSHHVGTFASIEEAEAAVIAKRLELFTHNDLDRRAA
jgi:hypothetical protein